MAETQGLAVIAAFDSVGEAEQAAKDLMGWDKANDDVKLGAIGLLTKDDKGEIKTKNYSSRQTGRGAKVGIGLGALAAVFSGGLTLVPGVVGGAVAGGGAGTLFRKGLGVSDADLQRLGSELDGGHAALLVMCSPDDAEATSEYLQAAGGRPQTSTISEGDLAAADKLWGSGQTSEGTASTGQNAPSA
jgi:uncharacterized membrane protein